MSLADPKRMGKLWNSGLIESVIVITLMLRSIRLQVITTSTRFAVQCSQCMMGNYSQ